MSTAAIVWNFFFSSDPNQILGTAVNVAIILIGMTAVVELWRASAQLSAARKALDRFADQLSGRTEAQHILALTQGLPAHHLMARRVQMLHELQLAGADIEPGPLSAMAVAELDREVKWSRWAASTVVLFGLAGTLIGLSQAVLRAQPMLLDIVSGPAAVQAVIGTFSGLGTAFSTTLTGILFAVILGIYLGRFRGAQGEYLQHIETVSLVRLVPYFRTSTSLAMVEAARTLTSLEQKLAKELNEIVTQVRLQGSHLIKTVEDSLGDVVQKTQERGVALTSTVDSSFAALTEELRTGNVWLQERLESTLQAVQQLVGEPGPGDHSLSENIRVLQVGVESMNRAAERMNQMAPAIEEALARQVDRQSRDLHETMHAYTGHLKQAAERQDVLLSDGFQRLEQGVSGFGEVLLTQLQEHDRGLLEGVSARTEQVAMALKENGATQQGLREALSGLTTATNNLGNHGDGMREATVALQDASTRLHVHLDNLGSRPDRMQPAPPSPTFDGRAAIAAARPVVEIPRAAPAPAPDMPRVGQGAPTVEMPSARRDPPPVNPPAPKAPEPTRASPTVSGPVKKPGFFARLFGRG